MVNEPLVFKLLRFDCMLSAENFTRVLSVNVELKIITDDILTYSALIFLRK